MDTLRGYSGWGGCADAFSDKPEWRTIRDAIEQALTPEEYTQARASTLTAYYTPGPVVKAMWDALRIGPTPIQVLEPGCGTGNFMAGIPDDVAAHVSGVELDPISARIAAALNPDATILNADLADCTIQQGSFDLAIGNVPYSGDISLDYRTTDGGTSRLPLHDYFIERSVDALRPGGVAMLLTSRYTLDKRSETMRADLARKAELVGVVRLPSSTFARQAGTEAVTDVLVLRRRERTLDHTPDEAWIHSTPIAVPGYQDVTVNVNQAVANDMPTHAVGDIRPVIGRFGGDFDVVFQGDTERIGERLRTLLSMQITHGRPPLQLGEMEPAERAEVIVRPDHVTPFEYSVDQRGVVWYGDGATVTEAAHGQGDEARRLRGMIRLRDLARELQRLELDPAHVDDPAVETKRKELDQAYDRFTGEFGRLNDRANRRAYDSEESGRHLVMALEETDEKGRFVGKAKCLSQRTISPVPPMPDHADSLDDALNISLDRAGRVDLELIARLADTTVEEAEAGLGDRIIRDPYTGTVMPAEDYLTGDVGTKLDRVTAMADRLKRRAGTEAMTEFTASTYATPEDMPATERAGEWISEAGADVWRSLKDPYSAESYRDPAPVIARRAAVTGRITLAVKAVHEHESGTEMPGPYLTGPSSIVSQLDRIIKNMATDPGKLTDRLADAERELAAARETLAEPFAHEDEYRQKQAELERLTSKPDEPRETESRDRETTKTERSARMPLTRESIGRLLERDPDIDGVTQGGNAMGHYLEARLTDGRAVQIDFHDNPAWKDTDRLAGRIEVTYANRPQAEWQYDDNDMADREHTVIDPAEPDAGKRLAKAVSEWERAGGLRKAHTSEPSHLAAHQPPEEYAYRWRKPGDPDRHIAYLSTAFDRDQAMKAREDAGCVVTKVDEDPAVLYEQHRKASCLRASHILERYDSPDPTAVGILHGIVGEVNAHDPENDIAAYLTYPSDKAVQLAGDGLTAADIAEKREMGGWNPRTDQLMRINAQGDWTGVTQQQADQLVWDNRDEILARASYDGELSTWTLRQLDQLDEPSPERDRGLDRQEPERPAPAREQPAPKRHGLGL